MKYPYVRRLPEFQYLAPNTVDEVLSLLAKNNGQTRIMAGGTDLLNKMKKREDIPGSVIGLKNVSGLDSIHYDPVQGLSLGPLVTIHDVETSSIIQEKYPILAQAASTMASAQIRNLGTVVGNLCSAVPSADTAPGLLVLGANIKIASANAERTVAIEDFFTGPSQSIITKGELVVGIQVPNPPPRSGMVYIKHTVRAAMELAIVGVAVLLNEENGTCSNIRIALGAVAPTPIRAKKAESILKGKPFSTELIDQAAEAASDETKPLSDIRASATYRREMVNILLKRAINGAREQLG